MKVSQLSKQAGVTAETVRYYTRCGLLEPKQQTQNGYRYYCDSDLARLMLLRKATLLGYGLSEITEILQMSKHGHTPCPRVREILEARLIETRAKLNELKSIQMSMVRAAEKWAEMPNGMPNGNAVCRLIDAFVYSA